MGPWPLLFASLHPSFLSFSGTPLGTEFQLWAATAAWERTLRSASEWRSRDVGASVSSVLPASGERGRPLGSERARLPGLKGC